MPESVAGVRGVPKGPAKTGETGPFERTEMSQNAGSVPNVCFRSISIFDSAYRTEWHGHEQLVCMLCRSFTLEDHESERSLDKRSGLFLPTTKNGHTQIQLGVTDFWAPPACSDAKREPFDCWIGRNRARKNPLVHHRQAGFDFSIVIVRFGNPKWGPERRGDRSTPAARIPI